MLSAIAGEINNRVRITQQPVVFVFGNDETGKKFRARFKRLKQHLIYDRRLER